MSNKKKAQLAKERRQRIKTCNKKLREPVLEYYAKMKLPGKTI